MAAVDQLEQLHAHRHLSGRPGVGVGAGDSEMVERELWHTYRHD